MKMYKMVRREQEVNLIKDKLSESMVRGKPNIKYLYDLYSVQKARKQLEKISCMDFNQPAGHLKEAAEKFG